MIRSRSLGGVKQHAVPRIQATPRPKCVPWLSASSSPACGSSCLPYRSGVLWEVPKSLPSSAKTLWRYMSFPKYVHMVATQSLYFCRGDLLDDPLDGAMPENLQRKLDALSHKARETLTDARSALEQFLDTSLPPDHRSWPELGNLLRTRYADVQAAIEDEYDDSRIQFVEDILDEHTRATRAVVPRKLRQKWRLCERAKRAQSLLSMHDVYSTHNRKRFVNCWHSNSDESDAMWRLYAPDSMGVAIRSSVGCLRQALAKHNGSGDWASEGRLQFTLAKMRYVDLDRYRASFDQLGFIKRKAFRHEQEVRAVASFIGPIPSLEVTGIDLVLALDRVIDAIVVHPNSPWWFHDVVCRSTPGHLGESIEPSRLRVDADSEVAYRSHHSKIRKPALRGNFREIPWRTRPRG